jgi:hypothetical protein
MAVDVLWGLALLAGSFAVYSLASYIFADHQHPRWLTGIIALNLGYCVLSGSVLVLFWSDLTFLGILYFLSEKFIVLAIVSQEWKALQRVITATTARL